MLSIAPATSATKPVIVLSTPAIEPVILAIALSIVSVTIPLIAAVASERILLADAKILPITALPKSGKLDKIDGKHNAPLAMAVN